MREDEDWIDAVRNALHAAETPPPAGGWERLERALTEREAAAGRPAMTAANPGRLRPGFLRRAVAAAAVLVCAVLGGEGYLWYRSGFRNVAEKVRPAGDLLSEAVLPRTTLPDALSGPMLSDADGSPEPAGAGAPRVADAVEAACLPESPLVLAGDTPERLPAPVGPAVEPAGRKSAPGSDSDSAVGRETATACPMGERPAGGGAAVVSSAGGRRSETAFRLPGRPAVRRRLAVGFYARGGVSGGRGSRGAVGTFPSSAPDGLGGFVGEEGKLSPMRYYDRRRGSFRHHLPLGAGLSIGREFAHGLSLETGLRYTLLRSEVGYWRGAERFSQRLHFLGVPLRMNWRAVEWSGLSIYISAGGMVEKCVAARFGGTDVEEPGVQWSVQGAVGVQYRLLGAAALYFEPEASYYFNDTRLRTSRSDDPLTLALRLGLRLTF